MIRATHNPSRISFLMVLLTMLLTTLQFSPRLLASDRTVEQRSMTIGCRNRYISQRDAGWLTGTGNFSHAYARRAQLYANVARACASGVAAVRVQGTALARPGPAQARR